MGPLQGAVLELRRLGKRYGKVPALSGLDLTLRQGQVYGFLGRNGAGKSTTLRIVMGVTRADGGEIKLFGEDLRPGSIALRQRIGYVAQEQNFYDWMTPSQLGSFVGAFYPRWDAGRYSELLRRFDVPERKVRALSGGTRVKLALALALGHAPELLVLDEPTAGLDAVARREFLEIVRELTASSAHTTLLSSHLIDEVEAVADAVGIIDAGQMLYEGQLRTLSERVWRLELDPQASLNLEGLPLRVLQDRVLGSRREVVVWLDDDSALPALHERAGAALGRLPLEDIFIALVRSRSR